MKRILSVNDISCIGRCSLTVALPVISASGVECSVLPTAVLSTHTGGFPGFTFRDLTEDMNPILNHWKSLGISVDAVYSGYLGSASQIESVSKIADDFGGVPLYVDPVMGDAGRLYANFDEGFVREMRSLCARADMITPNLTEACYLADEAYPEDEYDESFVKKLLCSLCNIGSRSAVISGISLKCGEVGAYSYDSIKDVFAYYPARQIDGFYHGAGDVFASVLFAAAVQGADVSDAIGEAVDFTVECIEKTAEAKSDTRFGLHFESLLWELNGRMDRICARR